MSVQNSKKQIIETYYTLIEEFFTKLNDSDVMIELNYPISSIYNGINTIHRVFEYILIKTQSLQKTYYYCQRAYSYYLEYMEQIYKANLSQNLNHADAVLFVYKKTIFDIYDGELYCSSNTLTNIMTLNDKTIALNEFEWKTLFSKITKMTNILFHWENTNFCFNDRFDICKTYLLRFLQNIETSDSTIEYMEIIQQKLEFNYDIYTQLLTEVLKKINKKSSKIRLEKTKESYLVKFYVEEDAFREKFEKGDMKEFVKWLYQ